MNENLFQKNNDVRNEQRREKTLVPSSDQYLVSLTLKMSAAGAWAHSPETGIDW